MENYILYLTEIVSFYVFSHAVDKKMQWHGMVEEKMERQ